MTKEPLCVKKSRFGLGVFASRDIRRGEKICVMAGEKISAKQLQKVTKGGRDILIDPLQISDNMFVNMRKPYVLINHSCNPNAGIKNGDVLVAIKNIKKGEEILYDYSSVWFEAFRCRCGSKSCRRYIGSFPTMPKQTQNKYMKLGVVPKFIEVKIRKINHK